MSKTDVSSHALSLDEFLGTLVVDALEERHIATAGIVGFFSKADTDNYVVLRVK